MESALSYDVQRQKMVKEQLRGRGLRQPAVLNAFLQVPRERFVPISLREHSYEDRAIPIGHGQTISQPFVVGWMLSLLALKPTDRVLEVGFGSGYVLALLSHIVSEVYGLERIEALATATRERLADLALDGIEIQHGDGYAGWPEAAPFDKILVSAGGETVPEPLKRQLALAGRLVIPVGPEPQNQYLIQIDRLANGDFRQKELGKVRFVPLLKGIE